MSPVKLPFVVVSVLPSVVVPVTVGTTVLTGVISAIVALGELVPVAEPEELVAVTWTRIVLPTSVA